MLARTLRPSQHGRRYSFYPDYIVDTVADIDFTYLSKQGVVAALIDLDGTVVPRGTYEVPKQIIKHLANQPVRIYIATNRPRSRDLKNLKESLSADGVLHPNGFIGKPFPGYYAQAAREHGLKPEQVVMIGDRLLQDIFGANTAGMSTVAVRKLDKPYMLLDRLLSGVEARLIHRLASRYLKIKD